MSDPLERLTSALSDRYAIEHEIGRGGMAVVYLAEDLKHSRKVAIKVLGSELSAAVGAERFQREIEIAAQLNHPNILTLIDSGEAGDLLYYVMPYIEGDSLRERLAQGPLALDDAVRIARQVGSALSHAHGLGIVHRDIKPANVLFHGDQAVITDFGIAMAVTEAGGEKLTQTGIAIGTPSYMSPEQGSGTEIVDERSDIYSLGCVLYEMLTGEPPYTGRTAQAILARKMVEPLSSIRTVRETVPIGLEKAVTRSLAKMPADRFPTASEFVLALEEAGTEPTPVTLLRGAPLVSRRRVAGVGLALAALVAGAWWTWGGAAGSDGAARHLIVMPFDDLTADTTHKVALGGLYEGLRSELQRLQSLTVSSSQTARALEATGMTLPDIAGEHQLDLFVAGSLMHVGDSLRLSVELLRGVDEEELWSDVYAVPLDSAVMLAMLPRSIVRALSEQDVVELTSAEQQRLRLERAVDPAAQQLYNEAYFVSNEARDAQRVIALLEQAIEIDPDFAEAHAFLATAYISAIYMLPGYPPHEWYPRAKRSAERAIALDDAVAEGHSTLGWSLGMYDYDWTAALAALIRGFELDPGLDRTSLYYSFVLSMLGRHDEAASVAERAAELDPLNMPTINHVGTVAFYARRYQDAVGRFTRVLELSPNFFFAHARLPLAYSEIGAHEKAIEAAQTAASVHEYFDGVLGYVLASSGYAQEARRIADSLQVRVNEGRLEYLYPLASLYVALGESDLAFDSLERAYNARDANLPLIFVDPTLDPLRSDPRFDTLLERLNFTS